MVHVKEGLPFKCQLSVFRALVFLLLTHTCAGQSHLIGPPQPIVAIVGDDIILPCRLEPAVDAAAMTVEWARPDLNPRFVYLWRDGHELLVQQNPTYKGRASLFRDEMKLGDVSLKLSNVRLSDEGRYRCFIPSLGEETTMELKVGRPQMIGPPQPIVAIVGDDTVLPSHLEPAVDVVAMTLEWARPDLEPGLVHMWREGVNLLVHQHPSYEGRTSLFTDKLKNGDVSLKLSEVKLSDKGKYRCFIPSLDRKTTVELVVGAASSPVINISKSSSGVVLECESKGWYPEPELFWLDAEGKLLSAGAPETVRGPDGLYTVSSRVTVEKSHSNSFTCRVQQLSINQSRDTHIHVPDDFFMVPSNPAVPVAIGLSVALLCVVVIFVVWKWRRNKTQLKMHNEDGSEQREREKKTKSATNNTEHEFLMEGEGKQEQLKAERDKMKDVKKEKLEEENAGKHQENKREAIQTEREKTDLKIQREAAGTGNQKLRQETELQSDEPQREKGLTSEDELVQMLEKTTISLTRELQEKQNEQKHDETALATLIRQQRELENRRDELEMQLEDVERHRDEDEPNLNLDKRKAELDKELQKTEETLVSITREINTIQIRGRKQINDDLEIQRGNQNSRLETELRSDQHRENLLGSVKKSNEQMQKLAVSRFDESESDEDL